MSSHRLEESLKMGKIPLENTAVFLCDLQEKFRPAMLHYSEVITNAKKLVICDIIVVVKKLFDHFLLIRWNQQKF